MLLLSPLQVQGEFVLKPSAGARGFGKLSVGDEGAMFVKLFVGEAGVCEVLCRRMKTEVCEAPCG